MAHPQSEHAQVMTEMEYLAFDRDTEERYEYSQGEIRAMSGGSLSHSRIIATLGRLLGNHVAPRCEVFTSDMRLYVASSSVSYRYPDVMVICGEPVMLGDRDDIVTNPMILFEVLSPSTQLVDLNTKLDEYRAIPTVQDYFLVSQETARIDRYRRTTDELFELSTHKGLQASIAIESIAFTLSLADVYQKVTFDKDLNQ